MTRQSSEIIALMRGLQIVAEAAYREQSRVCTHLWTNSSLRELVEENLKQGGSLVNDVGNNPTEKLKNLQNLLQETAERSCVITEGLRQLILAKGSQINLKMNNRSTYQTITVIPDDASEHNDNNESNSKDNSAIKTTSTDAANLDISSITLKELEDILSKRGKNHGEISLRTAATESKLLQQEKKPKIKNVPKSYVNDDKLKADTVFVDNILKMVAGTSSSGNEAQQNLVNVAGIELPVLSKVAKQRKVPSTRLGRMASFGGLFAGLGFGTLNELTKGALGLGGSKNVRDAFLSPDNLERIVDTLCKVRGAALKIGQILSIQDSKVVSPQLSKAFDRVRQSADYMPDWQVERVINTQLGPEWRKLVENFDVKPFAAASIGQVHRATLKNGMPVAIKIQYPGVAQSIESDIDNLVGMLKVWDIFPEGFFIDNVVKVAKRELNWEVDYQREADYTEKFKEMVSTYPEYYVPIVIRSLTTSSVLTTELVPGVPLDKCFDLSYEHRKHIAECVMKLCLRELFELQCMQTDPNWSNFLYDVNTKRLMLIDFGSTRFYQKDFIFNYRRVIIAAANNDREGVLNISREMGFLTGYETKQMEEAHVDAVMILGEMLRYDGDFDFGTQNTTERIAHLVPTMVAHRLCPPPEEIYSIHRKLSGIFLLCARLKVKMNCRRFYEDIVIGKYVP